MQIVKKINFLLALIMLVVFSFGAFLPEYANAQKITDKAVEGLQQSSGALKVGDNITIFSTINGFIGTIIGILGVIAVALIIYAGGLWLTAAGREDNISQAKKIIYSTVIGIIIVGLAYAITAFVLSAIIN